MYAASKGHLDVVNHILTRDTEEVNAQNSHVRMHLYIAITKALSEKLFLIVHVYDLLFYRINGLH